MSFSEQNHAFYERHFLQNQEVHILHLDVNKNMMFEIIFIIHF